MTFKETCRAVLDEAVRLAVGDADALPRPGQIALTNDIADALEDTGVVCAVGPTGLGKSFAGLVPALTAAALHGERTILSTESLALQAQIVMKDAPTVAAAVETVTGVKPAVAVLKGWGNYICHVATHATAVSILEGSGQDADFLAVAAADPGAQSKFDEALSRVSALDVGPDLAVGDKTYDSSTVLPLLAWAGSSHAGARSDYQGVTSDGAWSLVSTTPEACLEKCPFAGICIPTAARHQAEEADLIVTNHALLGVQAAMGVPVLLGSRKLGFFDHLVVDEAHALPSAVRSSGSRELSPRRIYGAIKSLERVLVTSDVRVAQVLNDGRGVADGLKFSLGALCPKGEATAVEPRQVAAHLEPVKSWATVASRLLPRSNTITSPTMRMRLARVRNGLAALQDDVDQFTTEQVGVARWLEADDGNVVARYSPVDVGPAIASNLYRYVTVDDETGAEDTRFLSVVHMSATLSDGFPAEVSAAARVERYPSPFASAYATSAVYVPRLDPADLAAVTVPGANGKLRFDTGKHADWAADVIAELVQARGGSALVLSSTAAAGRKYAQRLREHTNLPVWSQWDGQDRTHVSSQWIDDEAAVLVGTRSYMTGLDARGRTCSLVIVDRVPRAAGNVVDAARVEALQARLGLDRWAADRLVYGGDAVTLLEQAVGRLIRSINDSGMVAILDPRLIAGTPISYATATGNLYRSAFSQFGHRLAHRRSAVTFLQEHAGAAA